MFQTLLDWIEITSITGDEEDYGDALSRRLAAAGLGVERQEVPSMSGAPGDGRFNVLARADRPEVV